MKTKLITILLLTIFSISCKHQAFVCSELKSSEISPIVMYDISFQFNRCRARCFNFNTWRALPANRCVELYNASYYDSSLITVENKIEGINFPIEKCEGIVGFSSEDALKEVRPSIRRLNDMRAYYCGNK